ncbi:MAG: nicotinamide-nucleotide amidohydrolase family protein [Gammaproteobacteria bacterium]|nr:nicotinamide-nucleotide amidohydrolase family protein [Gammaproteobacteria bacterium]
MTTDELHGQIKRHTEDVAGLLLAQNLSLATAESCTGGWIAKVLTDLAGSSAWFERGFVTYSNQAKMDQLAIKESMLIEHGAVSEAVVLAMAEGVLSHSLADVALAVSGIAGPGGGSEEKPVGRVWLAWSQKNHPSIARLYHFDGDREAVRAQSVVQALQGVRELLRRA